MHYTLGNSAAFEEKDSHSSQDFFALSFSRPTCWINASKDCLMSIWKVSNPCFNSWSSKQSNWQCYQTTIRILPPVGTEWLHKLAWQVFGDWGGVYMRKLAQAWVSYCNDFFISYCVYWMTRSFNISVFEGTLHGEKIHVWFKIANITHVLPVAVYRQTDFTPKCVVVAVVDTVVTFRTRVNFSPRYNKQGELMLGWLVPAWHFESVSCKEM